jgi:hypothetical protein
MSSVTTFRTTQPLCPNETIPCTKKAGHFNIKWKIRKNYFLKQDRQSTTICREFLKNAARYGTLTLRQLCKTDLLAHHLTDSHAPIFNLYTCIYLYECVYTRDPVICAFVWLLETHSWLNREVHLYINLNIFFSQYHILISYYDDHWPPL